MNDTLSIKGIISNTIDAAELDAVARDFARIASPSNANDHRRSNSSLGSLSPTVIRIAHQLRKTDSDVQRSLFAVDQTLTRLDAQSNPIGKTAFKAGFQCDIPSDVTLAEFRAGAMALFGALLASDAALVTAMYYGEY